MAKKTSSSAVLSIPLIIAFAVVGLVLFSYMVKVTKEGAGTTVSRASKPATLTAGDDVLSLEQDLRSLQKDETFSDESTLAGQ